MIRAILCISAGILIAPMSWAAPTIPMSIVVNASDGARRLLHSELTIAVHPGPLVLVYPRWAIPTYEAPNTIVDDIVDLKFIGNGKRIEWHRDLVNMFSFNLAVPKGVSELTVTMDVVAPPQRTDFNVTTGQLLILDWNTVMLYPKGSTASALRVRPRLLLPVGWRHSCAMRATELANGELEYPTTTLATLVDSPVLAGKYFSTTRIPTDPAHPVFVNIAADTFEATALPERWQRQIRRMVAEAAALFGNVPYEHYDFQVALSAEVGNDGVEHRQSSDIRMATRGLVDDANRLAYGYLIPHEYIHVWNGKFRIPAGVVRPSFEESQTTELLWVYEGLTRYLNWVLAARSGILSIEEARDYAALLAAKTVFRSGRDWRSLQDTAVSTGILNDAPEQWESLRRSTDYYDEALFIWLDADTTIRKLTHGQRSLDDFCKAFFGTSGKPTDISPYTFADLISALNGIAPHDWSGFFRSRLDAIGIERAPLAGLSASGWALSFKSTPGSVQAARDQVTHTVEERFSLGLRLQEDGTIVDTVRNSPAWQAGLWPGMKLQMIDGQPWSADVFRGAIVKDTGTTTPLRISVQNGSESFVASVDDSGGARYPQLARNDQRDLMGKILEPRTDTGDAR